MKYIISLYKGEKIAGFFILINLLYLTHGLIPALRMAYVMMLYLILALSFYYCYKVNATYYNSGFIKALDVFVLLITIYGFVHILQPIDPRMTIILQGYQPHTYLTNAYMPLLQIYPLYFFSRKGYIDEQVIKSWIIPSVIAVVLAYYVSQLKMMSDVNSETVEGTSNVGYLVVSIIPALHFYKNTIVKYSILSFVIILVFLCAKRGAILIAYLSLLWLLYYDLKTTAKSRRFLILILVAIAGIFLYQYILRIYENSYYMNYLLEKTMEGDSSGRDVLYSKAWDHFINANVFIFLFGNGADSTYILLGNRAHSDWLELLTNHGVLGVIIYAIFWIEIFRCWKKTQKQKFLFIVLGLCVILFFNKSLFSMWYNSISPVACLPFAWCMAKIDGFRKDSQFLRKFNFNGV